MNPDALDLPVYLAAQLQQIIEYGPNHYITWASCDDWQDWFQAAVLYNSRYYISITFPLTDRVTARQMDRIFQRAGWLQAMVGDRESLVYYILSADSLETLWECAEKAALQCAAALYALWGSHLVSQVALLGVRGPNVPVPARRAA